MKKKNEDIILYGLKSFTKFIIVLKLLSYTTHKIFTIIRDKIYNYSIKGDILKGEVEADEAYFGGKRKGKRGRGSKIKNDNKEG